MIEWATRPYYSPRGAIYEARLMEAALVNALHRAGTNFGERLHYWHGNLLFLTDIGHHSIPGNWAIAKRRYLRKMRRPLRRHPRHHGIHSNLSLPDPLFAWDFMHLSASERETSISTNSNPSSTSPPRASCAPSHPSSSRQVRPRRCRPKSAMDAPWSPSPISIRPQSHLPQSLRHRPPRPLPFVQRLPANLLRPGAPRRPLWEQQLDSHPRPQFCRTRRADHFHDERPTRLSLRPRLVRCG
jgi:hypothetical protein